MLVVLKVLIINLFLGQESWAVCGGRSITLKWNLQGKNASQIPRASIWFAKEGQVPSMSPFQPNATVRVAAKTKDDFTGVGYYQSRIVQLFAENDPFIQFNLTETTSADTGTYYMFYEVFLSPGYQRTNDTFLKFVDGTKPNPLTLFHRVAISNDGKKTCLCSGATSLGNTTLFLALVNNSLPPRTTSTKTTLTYTFSATDPKGEYQCGLSGAGAPCTQIASLRDSCSWKTAASVRDSGMPQERFLVEPADDVAVEGTTVLLRCQVANRMGVLQWFKDEFSLGFNLSNLQNERYSVVGDKMAGEYNLRITKVRTEDAGVYECQVGRTANTSGLRSRMARLRVVPPTQACKSAVVSGVALVVVTTTTALCMLFYILKKEKCTTIVCRSQRLKDVVLIVLVCALVILTLMSLAIPFTVCESAFRDSPFFKAIIGLVVLASVVIAAAIAQVSLTPKMSNESLFKSIPWSNAGQPSKDGSKSPRKNSRTTSKEMPSQQVPIKKTTSGPTHKDSVHSEHASTHRETAVVCSEIAKYPKALVPINRGKSISPMEEEARKKPEQLPTTKKRNSYVSSKQTN